MNKSRIGTYGEEQAISYLKNCGYVILEKKYRSGRNEIDIICEKGGVVVFVEVKKRWNEEFGTPLDAIDSNKIEKVTKTAQEYLYARGLLEKCKIRFDVIGIQDNKLEHIENAFG
jgi:putative endonuclease